jgi:hypothetical protein
VLRDLDLRLRLPGFVNSPILCSQSGLTLAQQSDEVCTRLGKQINEGLHPVG